MKSQIFISLMVFTFFFSCKKDSINTEKAVESPRNVERLILDFKAKLDATLKDGTTYAADSAVWYVEALLNYSYGYATALGCTFETDTASIIVNSVGVNGYTLAQLSDVYEYLEENALEHKPEDRYIFCIDVFVTIEDNVTTFSSISGYAKLLKDYKSTDDDDPGYWFWGDALGMCDKDLGNNIGMDAGDIIEALVNATAEYDYFTNIEYHVASYTSYSYANFPFHDDYLIPNRLFAYRDTTGPNEDFCLTPAHISFYSGSNGALYVVGDNKPSNREFAYCTIYPMTYPYDVDTHVITIFYGSPNEGQ